MENAKKNNELTIEELKEILGGLHYNPTTGEYTIVDTVNAQ